MNDTEAKTMTTAEIKQQVLANMDTVRGLKYGLKVADLVFGYGVMPEIATAALSQLVREGVLVVSGRTARTNVYRAA